MTDFDYNADKFSQAKSSQVGCCLRGVIFDNWVRQFLEQNLQATVIEIGAGLNTRFERVDNGRQVYTGSIWICQRCDSELSFRCQFYRMPTK